MDDEERRKAVEQHWNIDKATQNEMWIQKRRLADAMRLVIERLVPSNAPEAELAAAADGLERYAERLSRHPRMRSAMGHAESANAGDVGAFFDQSPMIGLANPLAPPIAIEQSGPSSALGRVVFGSAYEGPPGCLHGGFVAAAFDEVLGFVQSLGGNPGFTGRLTIHYRSPTPLHAELLFAGRILKTEGRKTTAIGELHAGDRLCAEAEGLFIASRPGRMEELQRERVELEAKLAGGS